MALNFADRVRETASAPGTGAVTLLGAVTGYQTFAAIGNTNQTYYTIATQGGTQWEVGLGTYSNGATGSTQAAGPTTGSWATNGSLVGSNITWYSASDTGYTAGDYVLLFDQTAGSSFFYYGQITLIQFAGGFGWAFSANIISDGGTPNGDPSSSWIMQESTGTTLTRNTVISNSLGTTAFINFSSGTQDVFCTYPSETAIFSDNNPGTAGYVLTSNGAGLSPSWEQAGGSNIFSGFYLSADRSVLYVDYSDGTPSYINTANYLTWTAAINTSYSVADNNLNMLI